MKKIILVLSLFCILFSCTKESTKSSSSNNNNSPPQTLFTVKWVIYRNTIPTCSFDTNNSGGYITDSIKVFCRNGTPETGYPNINFKKYVYLPWNKFPTKKTPMIIDTTFNGDSNNTSNYDDSLMVIQPNCTYNYLEFCFQSTTQIDTILIQ